MERCKTRTRFSRTISVSDAETDRLGHTNNVKYLEWLEAIAWEHMDALGCPWETMEQENKAMAITLTEMQYLQATYAVTHWKLIRGSATQINDCIRPERLKFGNREKASSS